jgi:hypothetical protein
MNGVVKRQTRTTPSLYIRHQARDVHLSPGLISAVMPTQIGRAFDGFDLDNRPNATTPCASACVPARRRACETAIRRYCSVHSSDRFDRRANHCTSALVRSLDTTRRRPQRPEVETLLRPNGLLVAPFARRTDCMPEVKRFVYQHAAQLIRPLSMGEWQPTSHARARGKLFPPTARAWPSRCEPVRSRPRSSA